MLAHFILALAVVVLLAGAAASVHGLEYSYNRGRWIGPKGVSALTYLTKIVVQGLGGTVK